MIGIIDYGVGNLHSLVSSFRHIGADAAVISSAEDVKKANRLILPGVGAFEDAAELHHLFAVRLSYSLFPVANR